MDAFYFVFDTPEAAWDALPEFDSDRARELREQAARARQQEQESFDRCDTDGFLSQWASSITAAEKDREADLANRGGLVISEALMDVDSGQIVCACITIEPDRFAPWKTSHKWIFPAREGRSQYKREYVTDYKRDSSFAALGLRKVWLVAPGRMLPRHPGNHCAEPRGLSGCAGYHGKDAYIDLKAAGLQ
jgi:hypothetical protein